MNTCRKCGKNAVDGGSLCLMHRNQDGYELYGGPMIEREDGSLMPEPRLVPVKNSAGLFDRLNVTTRKAFAYDHARQTWVLVKIEPMRPGTE